MAFLIRTVDTTQSGREITRTKTLENSELTIGRAADNDIHIADLAVEQHHVKVTTTASGTLNLEAVGTLGFTIDGRTANEARVDPKIGGELVLGSSALVIGKEEDGSTGITIRRLAENIGVEDVKRSFALASALPGKRAMAWAFAGVILILLLAVPVYSHLTRDRVANDADELANRNDAVLLDSSWSSGKLSIAHHSLENNCESCHVDAFVSVRDETCLTCHEDLGDHADPMRLADGRAPLGTGDALQWQVAQMFGKEGPGSCTTCHTEHEGEGRMEPAAQEFCADCHDALDTRLTDTKLGNAKDFGYAHPQFQAAIFTAPGQTKPQRISLDKNPIERSGLKFPHDVHLSPRGGVARMAINLGKRAGYGAALECSDCHEEGVGGVDFKPVNMEDNCEACHSLVYDQVGGTFRTLRHGDVDQMRADLLAMDRAGRAPINPRRDRPGKQGSSSQFAPGGRYYTNFGRPGTPLGNLARALRPDGVCGECHLPDYSKREPAVMPVNLPERFFLHGGFDHDAHKQEECSTCHKAESSERATDLLMPDLAVCRECHEGEDAVKAEVPSGCAMCHSYHMPSGPRPKDHPGQKRDVVAIIEGLGRNTKPLN